MLSTHLSLSLMTTKEIQDMSDDTRDDATDASADASEDAVTSVEESSKTDDVELISIFEIDPDADPKADTSLVNEDNVRVRDTTIDMLVPSMRVVSTSDPDVAKSLEGTLGPQEARKASSLSINTPLPTNAESQARLANLWKGLSYNELCLLGVQIAFNNSPLFFKGVHSPAYIARHVLACTNDVIEYRNAVMELRRQIATDSETNDNTDNGENDKKSTTKSKNKANSKEAESNSGEKSDPTDEKKKTRRQNASYPFAKGLTTTQVVTIMQHIHHLCLISTNESSASEYDLLGLFVEKGDMAGTYVTTEQEILKIACAYEGSFSINDCKEIISQLRRTSKSASVSKDRALIPVNNGIFNYETKKLEPFHHSKIFLSKSRVNYNPDAKDITIHNDEDGTDWTVESWMESLSDDPEIVRVLWQIIGAIIRPNVSWNKSAWLYSERGNNGKGTLCAFMRNICGPDVHTSLSINDFTHEFKLEKLIGKSAVITDENDVGTFIDKAAHLKAVITNDVILINRKNRIPVTYQFHGFMVQCLNEFPRIKDRSESFYRRQLFIPMTKNFTGAERRYIKDDYINRKEVLEYTLKRVLHMDYYVLDEPAASKAVLDEYKSYNDPVREFWMEHRDAFQWDLLPFTFLYDLYKAWFSETTPNTSAVSSRKFISELMPLLDNDSIWECEDKAKKIWSAERMDKPEPLIASYNLKRWINETAAPADLDGRCTPVLSLNYRGINRKGTL